MLLSILSLFILEVEAQTGGYIEYKPARRNPQSSTESRSPSTTPSYEVPSRAARTNPVSLFDSATPTYAVYLDNVTDKAVKIKIKIIENKNGLFIVGYKKIVDEYWKDISSLPVKASKVDPYSKLAEHFEYSAYIMAQTIYF